MIRPVDLKDDELWSMFLATIAGDAAQVRELAARRPALALAEYNYTPPIHFAVREGHLDLTRFFLDHGADPTYRTYPFQDGLLTMARDRERTAVGDFLEHLLATRFPVREGIEPLLEAAKAGDLDTIRGILARDSSLIRGSNETGDTVLHQAAMGGQLRALNLLLDAGADPDAVRADGRRPIHCALDFRRYSALRAGAMAGTLLARGARYNIYLAAALGDMFTVREELARDRDLANFEETSHQYPISAATNREDIQMVRLLLDHGANPSLPEHGAPLGEALWTAVYRGYTEIAKLLLEHGANPNTAPESSGPAVMHAKPGSELHTLLLQYGAVEKKGPLNDLMARIDKNDLPEVERTLREHPEIVNDNAAYWGDGILAGPCNSANREIVEMLFRVGARVPDVSKWGPYYYFKHTEIAALLLERGMNPNHSNWYGFTLLHHMAATGDLAKATLLLDHGADIDRVDEEYCSTPLGCAARWGRLQMTKFLLERGADREAAGAPWASPLAWARKKGHPEIEALLS
jgi:ankyrin repeat protein